MKTLDKGQDKIKKICSILRDETIEPAKKDAEKIIKEAQKQAEQIINEAHKQAESIINDARHAIEQEKNVFHSSLLQASKQGIEALKQSIEHKLFNEQLVAMLESQTTDPKVISNLINAIVKSVEKEGLEADLTAIIPKNVVPKEVNKLLLEEVLKKLKDHTVTVGNFKGGAQVKIVNKKMTIDISEESLQEILASYIRKDFRKMIFAS